MKTAELAYNTLSSKVSKISDMIGNTPLLPLDSLSTDTTKVYAKAEWKQLGSSVKARAAYAIIQKAIDDGDLHNHKTLLDASSGNTAIAYGAICKELGLKVTICLPENASKSRIEELTELGVEIIYTSPFEGTDGAQQKAKELYALDPVRYFYADQYNNANNWKAHYNTTALEILNQTNNSITHFIAGLGTTGTFTGTSRRLKEKIGCTCIALQPESPMHIMEGWKHLETAVTPGIYDNRVPDEIIHISTDDTIEMMLEIERTNDIRISPSSAANLVGAKIVAQRMSSGVVVTMLPDSIERYKELEAEIFAQ